MKYQVNFGPTMPDQPPVTKDSVGEARAALTSAGNPAGASFKAVPA